MITKATEVQYCFELLKPFGTYKVGDWFDCYGGFVYGIGSEGSEEAIDFKDEEWFKFHEINRDLDGKFKKKIKN